MTNSKPLFTIITVCYNSESTLAGTFNSILSQSLRDFEYLVIDGQSTDSTLKVIKDFQPKFSQKDIQYHYISEADSGIYDAMNKGIKLASGTWIGILNADDIYAHNDVLRNLSQYINNHLHSDVVYADLDYVAKDNLDKVIRHWHSGEFKLERVYFGWIPPHPAFFIKSNCICTIGNYNTTLAISADYEFMLRALLRFKLTASYFPEVIIKMRMGGASNKLIQNRITGHQNIKKAWVINQLEPRWYTFICRLLRKLPQYFH